MTNQHAWEPGEGGIPSSQISGQYHGVTTGRWRGDGRKTHTTYAKRVMVLIGTLGGGIDFYGPFDDAGVAMKWAEANLHVGADVRLEILNIVKE